MHAGSSACEKVAFYARLFALGSTSVRCGGRTRAAVVPAGCLLGTAPYFLIRLFLDRVAQKYQAVVEPGGLDQLQVPRVLENARSLAA